MESTIPMVLVKPGIIEMTKIYSGNCELIDSRSIILFASDEPIEIEEIFNKDFRIRIKIANEKDGTNQYGIKIDVDTTQNIIKYTCMNFDNVLGTGTNKGIEVGTFGGKKIYIHFWIYTMGDNNNPTRRLEYSLWKER